MLVGVEWVNRHPRRTWRCLPANFVSYFAQNSISERHSSVLWHIIQNCQCRPFESGLYAAFVLLLWHWIRQCKPDASIIWYDWDTQVSPNILNSAKAFFSVESVGRRHPLCLYTWHSAECI